MLASIRIKYVIVIVLLVIVAGVGVVWANQTAYAHRQWATMFRESQRLRSHLEIAAYLLNTPTIETNKTAQNWFSNELQDAKDNLYELDALDQGHWLQLFRIDTMIEDVDSYWPIFGLNSSMRSDFAGSMHDLGDKVVKAYGVYGDYISGPSIWYFGSAPPDESKLEEALKLVEHVEKTLYDLQTVHLPTQP